MGAVDLGLTPADEPIGVRHGRVRRHRLRGHLRVRRPGPADRDARPVASGRTAAEFDEIADELELSPGSTRGLPAASAIEKVVVDRGEITFYVAPRAPRWQVARELRDEPGLRFELCHSVSGVHYPGDTGRELHAVHPPAVDDAQAADPAGGDLPGRRPRTSPR